MIRRPPSSTLFPSPPLFRSAWIFLIYGALLPLAFLLLRRGITVDPRSPETLKAMAGGFISFLSYGAITAALALGKDRKSTRLNSSHSQISYAVFCLKKKILA